MAEKTLTEKVRGWLNDSTGERFTDADAIGDALRSSYRELLKLQLPKEYLIALSIESGDIQMVEETGLVAFADAYLRIIGGTVGCYEVVKIISPTEIINPNDSINRATRANPWFQVKNAALYVIPQAYDVAKEKVRVRYIADPDGEIETVKDKIPPVLEEAIVLGAAYQLALGDSQPNLAATLQAQKDRQIEILIPSQKKR